MTNLLPFKLMTLQTSQCNCLPAANLHIGLQSLCSNNLAVAFLDIFIKAAEEVPYSLKN